MFDFDGAGAVVEFVGDVGGLGGDVADLADEGDLLDFDVVDFELGVGMRLGGVEDLFDGAGAEGVFRLADVSLVERRGGALVHFRWERKSGVWDGRLPCLVASRLAIRT